jgi:antitoxin ParD1/3/4
MGLSLTPETERLIEERVKRGGYASADDAVRAALASLGQQENHGDFAPGELDRLIAEAEAQFERGEVTDAEEVFGEIRAMSAEFRRNQSGTGT